MTPSLATPENWSGMTGVEIFDTLGTSGLELGHTANKMIKMLKAKKFFPAAALDKLAKTKKEKEDQRELFAGLGSAGLGLLQEKLNKTFGGPSSDAPDTVEKLTRAEIAGTDINLKARAWHLVDDPAALFILETIFGGVGKEARRATLDDKATRDIGWKQLCDEFFNKLEWNPENTATDSRVKDVDPSKAPAVPWSPEDLRKIFSSQRTQFTIFTENYHASGNLEDGNGDGTDLFFSDFSGSDVGYLYAFLLLGDRPPKFCTRDVMQPTDVGIGGHDNDGAEKVIELSTRPKNLGKRKKGLEIEDMREIFALSDVEILREVSMTGYFCTQTSIARLEAMRKVVDGQGFLLMD